MEREPRFFVDEHSSIATCYGWSPSLQEALARSRIRLLQVRDWNHANLEPLLAVAPLLESLSISCEIPDLAALADLPNLRSLYVRSGLESVDWRRVTRLEELGVEGSQCQFGTLDQCVSLQSLHLTVRNLQGLEALAGMSQLSELRILECPLRSLQGIEGLRGLQRLSLQQVPLASLDGLDCADGISDLSLFLATRLESVAVVAEMCGLRALELSACRRVRDIESIGRARGLERLAIANQPLKSAACLSSLAGLRSLNLDNVGAIPSLGPLRPLEHLEVFTAREGTRVADGDLRPLLDLPALREIELTDRPSYTHRAEEIMRIILGRGTWGPGPFDNHAAVRWTRSLRTKGPDPYGDVMRMLMAVSGAQEVPAKRGQEAVAAADVVARAYGRWGMRSEHSAAADAWVEANRGEGADGLHWHALAALHRVVSAPSSLLRLWQERGATEWLAAIDELRGRLSSGRG